MKISLMGYMGSGKSSVGKELAKRLDLKFIDLDQRIEEKENLSISEIFSTQGEIKFRKLEREILLETLAEEETYVLALGGGTPAYYNNIELINQSSFSIYLRLSPGQLKERLENESNHRPLLAHLKEEDKVEYIAKHLFERRNFYEQAHLTLNGNQPNIETMVDLIIQHLPHRD